MKNANADFGHGLADGGGKGGNLQVTPAAGRALAAVLSARQPAAFWEDKGSIKAPIL